MTKLEKARCELRKLAKEDEDRKWKEILSKYKNIGKYLVGKDIVQYTSCGCWSVTRVTKFELTHTTSSGFYGQWDYARYMILTGQQLGMNIEAHQTKFCTDGSVDEDDFIKGMANVSISGEHNVIGIPLAPKKRWASQWKKYIELGNLDARVVKLGIGEEAYRKKDTDLAHRKLQGFQMFVRVAVDGSIYDELEKHYWKRVKMEHELYEQFKDGRNMTVEQIDWEAIIK